MVDEWWLVKYLQGNYDGVCLQGLGETTKNQESWCHDRDSNWWPTRHKSTAVPLHWHGLSYCIASASNSAWQSGGIIPRILNLSITWMRVVSFKPGRFNEDSHRYLMHRRMCRPHSRSDTVVWWETSHDSSHYIDRAIAVFTFLRYDVCCYYPHILT
jgi:hypothetical protein